MKKANILSILIAALMVTVLLSSCGITDAEPDASLLHCSVTVTATDVLENKSLFPEEKLPLVPDDGIIFKNDSVAFNDGDDLLSVITKALQSDKVQYELQGGTYFIAFGNIYASDCTYGGWMYTVNGALPEVGAAETKLADGDTVEFFYVCDYNAYFGM